MAHIPDKRRRAEKCWPNCFSDYLATSNALSHHTVSKSTNALKTPKRLGRFSRGSLFLAAAISVTTVPGCAVVAVVNTVGTVAVKTVGLAADAAIGVVKITGRAVGTAADAVIPDGTKP